MHVKREMTVANWLLLKRLTRAKGSASNSASPARWSGDNAPSATSHYCPRKQRLRLKRPPT